MKHQDASKIGSHHLSHDRAMALIEAIHRAESKFIAEGKLSEVFDGMLTDLLALTGSEYGVIYELCFREDGTKYLLARAISNIAWNEDTRVMYQKFAKGEFIFDNPRSLFGAVISSEQAVIANQAQGDSRGSGVPPGHPPLRTFLGLPLHSGTEFVGVVGLANAVDGYSQETIDYLAPLLVSCANIARACRMEQKRKEMETELLMLNKELDSFTYTAAHDLRAPLRAIIGFSKILQEDFFTKSDAEAQSYLFKIIDSAQAMRKLIEDLLHLAKASNSTLRSGSLNMSQMAREIVEQIRHLDPERSIVFDCEDDLVAEGDPTLIGILLQNLLSNASKYTAFQPVAQIQFGHLKQNDDTVFFIKDNGVGFDMQHAHKLFQPFHRLHAAGDFPGSGVGLAIAKRIVTRHAGEIWAESNPGQGTTMYFKLSRERCSTRTAS